MVKSYIRLLKIALLLCLLLPIVVILCSNLLLGIPLSWTFYLRIFIPVLFGTVLVFIFRLILRTTYGSIEQMSLDQASYLDKFPVKYVDIAILGSAAVSLFLELAIIRWQSEIFPIFAFYKNYSLLACFAGLGLGYALARRKAIPLFLSIPIIVVQFSVLLFVRYGFGRWQISSLWRTPFIEQLNMGVATGTSPPYLIAIYFLLTVVFLLTALAFIPVGQLCGRLMTKRPNLRAYGFNLLGSILGVLLISFISFFWTPPVIWFSLCFSILLFFQIFNIRILLFGFLTAFIGVIILSWPVSPGIEYLHTPYQLLERGSGEKGLASIKAAGHYYQRVHDLSPANANRSTDLALQSTARYYDLPYRIYGDTLQHVAVVGSGTGNDVAAALRSGARHIDAIEIDPGILKMGTLHHPEKPYSNPVVHAVVNDARTFLRTTRNRYDMIVYGLLDSHTLLSHASSIRLDSFVYTVEAFKEARLRLKEEGVLCLSFSVMSEEIGRKVYLMMEEAFDDIPPVCIQAGYDASIIYLQAKNGKLQIDEDLLAQVGFEDITTHYRDSKAETDISTDDWPFFYMPKRVYPVSYLGMLALILLLSLFTNTNFLGQKPVFSNVAFLFLGAGFMLVETKAITELGLTLGNTWQVIGIVIGGILLMAFLANSAVQTFGIKNPFIGFLLLLISLLLGYYVSKQGGFGSTMLGKIGTIVLLTCPMFFSGIVFSTLLGQAKDIAAVMAINLFGSMIGGVLEYNSMYFGFRFLYLLALAVYILAMITALINKIKLKSIGT